MSSKVTPPLYQQQMRLLIHILPSVCCCQCFGFGNSNTFAPIHWPPGAKRWLIGKYPDAGKDWRQEKGITEDEVVGWHHWLNGHEFEQTLGDVEGQGSLACYSPWGWKGQTWLSDWTICLQWYLFVLICHSSMAYDIKHLSYAYLRSIQCLKSV